MALGIDQDIATWLKNEVQSLISEPLKQMESVPTSSSRLLARELLSDEEELPMSLLTDSTLPILHYFEIPFMEDDLADCGNMACRVRMVSQSIGSKLLDLQRVMPNFWYISLSQDVRVDGSISREVNVRIFHEFGSRCVLREVLWHDRVHVVLNVKKTDAPTQAHELGSEILRRRQMEKFTF